VEKDFTTRGPSSGVRKEFEIGVTADVEAAVSGIPADAARANASSGAHGGHLGARLQRN